MGEVVKTAKPIAEVSYLREGTAQLYILSSEQTLHHPYPYWDAYVHPYNYPLGRTLKLDGGGLEEILEWSIREDKDGTVIRGDKIGIR
jgi:hypothetical protein